LSIEIISSVIKEVDRLNLFDIWNSVGNNYDVRNMEITPEEKDMLKKIEDNQYTGGAYKRATFIDKVCRSKMDRSVLDTLRQKGLAETGLGGTVAGDVYDGCWLTPKGKEALNEGW
jgi:hypothetical protein